MEDELTKRIKTALASWVKREYDTNEVVVGVAAKNGEEDDEAHRYLVDFANRGTGYCLIAVARVFNGQILSLNAIGDGLPLEGTEWPWPGEEVR